MKRMTAILLTVILLLNCLPILTAAAKEDSVTTKFQLLLNDMEIDPEIHDPDQYYCHEIKKTDDWVLIRGGLRDLSVTDGNYNYHYATVGNKLVHAGVNSHPFTSGYGVFDVRSGVFYDITDAWNRGFVGLHEAWNDLPAHSDSFNECGIELIGDVDLDRFLTIMDATHIQRVLAELEYSSQNRRIDPKDFFYGWVIYSAFDYDRDGSTTVMDATKLQRYIAGLPNVIDYKLAWDERYFPSDYDNVDQIAFLINSLDDLDLSDSRLAQDINDPDFDAEKKIRDAYDDRFFRNNSLLVLDVRLVSSSYYLTPEKLSIDTDGNLHVDFSLNHPQFAFGDINDRFVVIEISKAFVDDIKDIEINVNGKTVAPYQYRPAKHPSLAVASIDGGDTSLITSRSQLDPARAGHQQLLDDYDEDFFMKNAILTVNYTSTALQQFSHIDILESVKVYIYQYTPRGQSIERTQVSYCFEISKAALARSDGKVELRLMDIDDNAPENRFIYNNDVDINHPAVLSQGFEEIYFEDAYNNAYSAYYTPGYYNPYYYPTNIYSSRLMDERNKRANEGYAFNPRGIAGIITNPVDLEDMLHDDSLKTGNHYGNFTYAIDQEYDYDLKFFDQYALVAITQQGYTYEEFAVNGLYKKDGTLYIDASLDCPTSRAPEELDFITLVKVDKQQLEDITAVSVGKLSETAFEVRITDDKKVDDNAFTTGIPVVNEKLSTQKKTFFWNQKYGDGSAFLNQPYRVAIIRTYEQYKNYFTEKNFEGLYAHDSDQPVWIQDDDGVTAKEIDKSFFDNSALVVATGFFSNSPEYLSFDDIRMDGSCLYIRLKRSGFFDPHPDEDDPTDLLGYCFAAAKIGTWEADHIEDVYMLPQVNVLI